MKTLPEICEENGPILWFPFHDVCFTIDPAYLRLWMVNHTAEGPRNWSETNVRSFDNISNLKDITVEHARNLAQEWWQEICDNAAI